MTADPMTAARPAMTCCGRATRARRPGRDRGRAAGGPGPAGSDLRAARPGGATCGRTAPALSRAAGGGPLAGAAAADLRRAAGRRAPLREPAPPLGVRRGDAVALLAPNCAELITATLAASWPASPRRSTAACPAQHLAELLRRSGARVLVAAGPELAPDDLADRARSWPRAGTRRDPGAAARPAASGSARAAAADRPACASATSATWPPSRTRPASPATRRRLGRPGRAVPHRRHHRGARSWPRTRTPTRSPTPGWSPRTRCSTPESVVFAALPLFHVNALVVTLLAPLFKGQQVVWAGPLGYREPALFGDFWKIVEHYRIAAMSARADGLRRARAAARSTPTSAACGSPWSAPRRCPPAVRDALRRRAPGCPCSRATA